VFICCLIYMCYCALILEELDRLWYPLYIQTCHSLHQLVLSVTYDASLLSSMGMVASKKMTHQIHLLLLILIS
jgi:hypothetical protein